MNNMILKLVVKMQNLLNNEEGQDLIEYALLAALIATAAITSAKGIATAVNSVFTTITSSI